MTGAGYRINSSISGQISVIQPYIQPDTGYDIDQSPYIRSIPSILDRLCYQVESARSFCIPGNEGLHESFGSGTGFVSFGRIQIRICIWRKIWPKTIFFEKSSRIKLFFQYLLTNDILSNNIRRGFRISVRGGRDFLGTKLFSGIRNKIQEKRYKTHKV